MPSLFVLDDDNGLLQVLQILLSKHRFSVQGFTKSDALIQALQLQTPDIILLDVVLAEEISGNSLCSKLRQGYHYQNKIYLFSATHLKNDDLLQCGANGFIDKPFDISVLIATLKQ